MEKEIKIMIGGLFFLLLCLLAGYKRTETQEAVSLEEIAEETITLTFLANVDSRNVEKYYEKLVHEFNRSHENINISFEGISTKDGYDTILKKRMGEGQGDDIYMVSADMVKEFYKKGYFYDLSQLPSYQILNAFAKDQCTINDIAYAVPTTMTAYCMLVNVGLLKDNGLEPPQNFNEWMTCCKVLKKNGITPFSLNRLFALTIPVMARGLYPIYTSGHQKDIIDGLNRGEILIGDYMLEGFKMFEIFVEEGYYGDGLAGENVNEINENALNQESFINGKTAFFFAAVRNGLIADIEKEAPDMEFVMQGIPALPNGTVCLPAVLTRVSINPASKYKEEAMEFVNYLTSWEGQTLLDISAQIVPLKKTDTYKDEDERYLAVFDLLTKKGQIPIEDMNLKFDYWDTVNELCFQIMDGMTAKEAAEAYNQYQMEQIELYDE